MIRLIIVLTLLTLITLSLKLEPSRVSITAIEETKAIDNEVAMISDSGYSTSAGSSDSIRILRDNGKLDVLMYACYMNGTCVTSLVKDIK